MQKITVEYTGKAVLLEAYNSLPQTGMLTVTIPYRDLNACLGFLEETGFCGMRITSPFREEKPVVVTAYKGKQGPCFLAGRKAVYLGMAKAAIDDDNHLMMVNQEIPVCEKTAQVLSFPPYRSLIRCNPPIGESFKELPGDPITPDRNSFENKLMELYRELIDRKPEDNRCLLFYPGPFKFLILSDGSVVRRCKVNSVPASMKEKLVQQEGMVETEQPEKTKPLCLSEICNQGGSAFFLYSEQLTGTISCSETTDLTVLSDLKTTLKERLTSTIQNDTKYFLLTGNDPKSKIGCCPSTEVEEAGILVQAGILCSYSQPVPDGTCPVTTYAFKGEMQRKAGQLSFSPNPQFRKAVLQALQKRPVPLAYSILKWILLAFIMASLLLLVFRNLKKEPVLPQKSLYEQLDPLSPDQVMLVLFHYKKRCEICLNMEQYTRDFLEAYNQDRGENSRIQFKLEAINDPDNNNLVNRFNLYTSTLVLIAFEKGKERQARVLEDAWQLYRDQETFTARLEKELSTFILQTNE